MDFEVVGYDYRTIDYLFREIFLERSYRFIAATEVPVIIDCGSNIGLSILYFKVLYPKARVYGFEPNPYAFELLRENIRLNGLQDVEVYNVALADRDTDVSFFIDGNIGTLRGSMRQDRGGPNEIPVKAQRLSAFIQNIGMPVDLLKIDVEGAESLIIDDLCHSGTIDDVRQIILEYHHKMNGEKGRFSHFLRKLEDKEFDYNIRTSFRSLGAFQDVLVNFYRPPDAPDGPPR